jgi:hypothetical protein
MEFRVPKKGTGTLFLQLEKGACRLFANSPQRPHHRNEPNPMSPAKQAANAANAQLSTGPTTAAGKARSSRNALKHGLTSQDLIVREDEQEEFQQLQSALRDQLAPEGALEMLTFNHLLRAAWNMQRAQRLETDLQVNGLDPLLDESSAKTLDRIHRHAAQAERSYYRHLKELRILQTNRALRNLRLDEEEQKQVPALVSYNDLTKRTHGDVQTEALHLAMEMAEYQAKSWANLATRDQLQIEATASSRKEGKAA